MEEIEIKVRKQQKTIVWSTGLLGSFFLWAGLSGGPGEYIKTSIIIGIVFLFTFFVNIIFYKKMVNRNIKYTKEHPVISENISNITEKIFKPINFFYDFQMLYIFILLVVIAVFSFIRTGKIEGLGYYLGAILVFVFYWKIIKKISK